MTTTQFRFRADTIRHDNAAVKKPEDDDIAACFVTEKLHRTNSAIVCRGVPAADLPAKIAILIY